MLLLNSVATQKSLCWQAMAVYVTESKILVVSSQIELTRW